MITYVYKCTNKHLFEARQSIRDLPLTMCQICTAPAYRVPQLNDAGVILYYSQSYLEGYADAHNAFCDKILETANK